MDFLQKLLWFLVAISVLVAAHEFGHYIVARKLGFKVLRFSIGFGRPLLSWRGGPPDHIQYWLSMIPLGGYVKMLDEHEGPVVAEERHRAFHQRPVWQRVLVLLAGPAFNFLFAILAYWLTFVTGVEVPKAIIGVVEPDSVAARSGLQSGDEIVTIGGRPVATLEDAQLKITGGLFDGRVELSVLTPSGALRDIELDVSDRAAELTAPPGPFERLGMRMGAAAVAAAIGPGTPAERAGLKPGDLVVRANDQPIQGWGQWVEFLRERPGETVALTVLRGDSELVLMVTLDSMVENGKTIGRIGIERRQDLSVVQRYGIVESLPRGVQKTWEMSVFTVTMVARMATGDVSPKNISGPLAIADIAAGAASAGFPYFVSLLALLSISLGILNLLPIPLLDGGQIVYQLAERIKGAPLSERAMIIGQQIGIVLIIALVGFAFYNDDILGRIFGS